MTAFPPGSVVLWPATEPIPEGWSLWAADPEGPVPLLEHNPHTGEPTPARVALVAIRRDLDGMARLEAWVADDLARHAPPVTPDEILAATGLFPAEILEHIADDLRRADDLNDVWSPDAAEQIRRHRRGDA